MSMLMQEELTEQIIGGAIEVHRELDPVYWSRPMRSASAMNYICVTSAFSDKWIFQLDTRDLTLTEGYRLDIVVESLVVIELKSIEHVLPIHHAQLLTYLRLSGKEGGLAYQL